MRIPYPALGAIALLALAAQPSMAVGFGRVVNATALGQALDVTVPVRVDSTERITADCLSAEVKVGDSPLASAALQLRLDPSPDSGVQWLRVYSSMRVTEPVIGITVSARCPSRISRQFVVFVDPPLIASESSVPTVVEPAGAAGSTAGLNGSTVGAAFLAPAAGSEPAARVDEPKAPPRLAASRPQLRKTRPPAAGRVSTDAQVSRASARKSPSVRPSAMARARASASRLKLQRAAALAAAPAMAAAASVPTAAEVAASAAAMSASAAAAASEAERTSQVQREQIADLQRRLEQSRLDIQVSNAAAAKLQARLQAAQDSRYPLPWLVALTVAVAVVLFGIGVLLDQRSLARRTRRPSWSYERPQTRSAPSTLEPVASAPVEWARSTAQEVEDDTHEAPTNIGPLAFNRAAAKAVAAPANVLLLSPVDEPPLTGAVIASGAPTRADPDSSALPITADALIDLEQRAEFCVALGQEDTAVDLLDGFLSGAGGACPMPYLMLLAIHRRRGDREAYAAVRARYGKRFNRSSPAWDGSAVATSIANHAEEMRRIESVWSDPPEAMRLIESLLVHGGTVTTAFDLHCLGELSFLYLLARDHLEIDAPPAEPVDVLLPMSALTNARTRGTTVDLELDFLSAEFPVRSK